MSDEQNKPTLVVGACIFNDEGRIFVMRSPKWSDKLTIPGGRVEINEKIEDALKREIKEETNLEIDDIEFVTNKEMINPADYLGKMRHFVGIDFKVHATNAADAKVDGREGVEHFWLMPEEIIDRTDVTEVTKTLVEKCIAKHKKGFFNRESKDCEKRKAEAEEYKIGWQRALADYQNLQKETSARRAEWAQMSEQQILEEFIPVYEHLKLAMNGEQSTSENSAWIDGVKHVLKQFADILKAHGVEEIKTVGEKFDPKYHEAVGHEATEGAGEDEIVKEISGGFKMGDRVIKAARVMVNK